jgi:uncharacterized protein
VWLREALTMKLDDPTLGRYDPREAFAALLLALSRPEALPEAVPAGDESVSIIQTHASAVILYGSRVYKLKKPNNFGFFDYSTPALRRHFCQEEVRLNARLAPHIYLGVAPVLASPGKPPRFGPTLSLEDVPEPDTPFQGETVIDFAVVMVRLPEEATLESLLARHQVDARLLGRVAHRIAEFHAGVQTSDEITNYGEMETIGGNWEENFAQMRPYIGRVLTAETFNTISHYAHEFMRCRARLFAARRRDGRIRDCHGDLRLQHIYCFSSQVDIIDCIEFNQRFRFSDVASEVAFLTMELDQAGCPDLARAFEAAYVGACGDDAIFELLPFYRCYRACVRGKVMAFQLDEPEIPAPQRESARRRSAALFRLAESYTRAPTAPILLMIGGLMGTGKSTLAEQIRQVVGWKVVASDDVRKQLAGATPGEPHADAFGTGLYSSEWTSRTYSALLQEALKLLSDGRSVVLDASFSQEKDRRAAVDLGTKMGARVVFAECRCPSDLVMERLTNRWWARTQTLPDRKASGGASDGRPELYQAQLAAWQPVASEEARRIELIQVPTSVSPEESCAHLLQALGIAGN